MSDAIDDDDDRRALAAGLMAEMTARLERLIEETFERHDGHTPADPIVAGANDVAILAAAYQILIRPTP